MKNISDGKQKGDLPDPKRDPLDPPFLRYDSSHRIVRSVWEPKKGMKEKIMSYVDEVTGEVIEGWPPSKVDQSAYEPMEQLIAKFLRGEIKPGQGDMPVYEHDAAINPEEAIANADPSRMKGFDKADASSILEEAASAVSELKKSAEIAKAGKGPGSGSPDPASPPAKSMSDGATK